MWADLTLMYQGDFIYLHELYKRICKEKIKLNDKRFNDIRTITKNIPQLNEIPILQLDSEFLGE